MNEIILSTVRECLFEEFKIHAEKYQISDLKVGEVSFRNSLLGYDGFYTMICFKHNEMALRVLCCVDEDFSYSLIMEAQKGQYYRLYTLSLDIGDPNCGEKTLIDIVQLLRDNS